MELEPVIGLEIHIQLKTESKMFCGCANVPSDPPPNSAICPICMGYPGTLPVPNKKAVEMIQRMGAALNCELAQHSKFDRKSYFYPDLPKGYQISQYDQPFCGKGSITIVVEGKPQTVGITRIHLEEDAAKNIHEPKSKNTLVDFNRAGTPLIEIVTEPDIRTPQEAKVFLQELQRVARVLGISDADMEKAQLRCDANISLREKGSTTLNPKTEVKNINSFRFVERALQYEIERQTKAWEKGNVPKHTTRGWNAETGKTTQHRTKEEAADYRYFPEPDIPPFVFTEEELRQIYVDLPELPYAKRERLVRQYQLSEEQASRFTDEHDLADFFENTASELEELERDEVSLERSELEQLVQRAANTILRNVRKLTEQESAQQKELNITPANFAELVALIHQEKVPKSAIDQILREMNRTGGDPDHIIQNLGVEQESNEDQLLTYVQQAIDANPDVVAKIKAGKDAALQYLVGQVMAKSRGTANPAIVRELLSKAIGKN